MTKEQQEAERLIKLFSIQLYSDYVKGVNDAHPKACAAICVKEIIEDINNPDTHLGFWNKVLEHINSK